MTAISGSVGPRACVAGIGTIVVDHVFVSERKGPFRYYGSRGGGTVWNVLAHLAQLGFAATAFGARAADAIAEEAVNDLQCLGVDVSALVVSGKHTGVFTQWLTDDTRHGPPVPQDNFTLDCPVCGRAPHSEQVPQFSAITFAPEKLSGPLAMVCADRLTMATAAAARHARAVGALAALDLGGVSGLSSRQRSELLSWAAEFDLIAMPAVVARWLVDGRESEIAERLLRNRTRILVLTRGPGGFDLFLRQADGSTVARSSNAPDVDPVVDATGAGDALTAALIEHVLRLGASGKPEMLPALDNSEALVAALKAAPAAVLGGIGARAGLPESPARSAWGKRLAPLRGSALDELRSRYAAVRPCCFCGLE